MLAGQRTVPQIPISVSTPLIDMCSDVFEDPLDPALFSSEGSTSQPSSSESPRDTNISQSDGDDELDLPSLDSLLNRNLIRLSSESHNALGHERPTESALQVQGWVEVPGPGGAPILQELSDHEPYAQAPNTDGPREGQWLEIRFAHDKPVPASDNRPASKEPDRVTIRCPICGTSIRQPSRRRQQIDFCDGHKLKDAEPEGLGAIIQGSVVED